MENLDNLELELRSFLTNFNTWNERIVNSNDKNDILSNSNNIKSNFQNINNYISNINKNDLNFEEEEWTKLLNFYSNKNKELIVKESELNNDTKDLIDKFSNIEEKYSN